MESLPNEITEKIINYLGDDTIYAYIEKEYKKELETFNPLSLTPPTFLHNLKDYIQFKIDINATNKTGYTPLMIASQYGDLALIKKLIKRGANLNLFDAYNDNALLLAIKYGHLPVVKELIKHGVKPTESNKSGDTPLLKAIKYKQIPILKLLLKYPDLNVTSNELEIAAFTGNIDILKLLLTHSRLTPSIQTLNNAIWSNNNELVFYVLDQIPELKTEKNTITPLMLAAGRLLSVRPFLAKLKRGELNKTDPQGKTALHYAVTSPYKTQSIENLKLLLEAGANPSIRDNLWRTPRSYAETYNREALKYLPYEI